MDSGRDQEVRLTDRRPAVGEVIELHGRYWKIVEELDPSAGGTTRFRARPSKDSAS